MPPTEAAALVAPLPARALPGVGHATERTLAAAGLGSVAALRGAPHGALAALVGDRVGKWVGP